MKNNKLILKHCPNFYNIINYEYYAEDTLSAKLIEVYQDYVFKVDINNKVELSNLEELDNILGKYINDYSFRNELKSEMTRIRVRKDEDILNAIVNWIIKVNDNYEVGYTRNIYFSRWI